MSRQVAFLRAVNVRGHASLSMKDLARAFAAAGCRDVQTYGHAGTIIFESGSQPASTVIRRVQTTILRSIGSEIAITVRSDRDIMRLTRLGPSLDLDWEDARAKRYVVFLMRRPARVGSLPILSETEQLELVSIRGNHAFVVSRPKPNRFYGMPNPFVEQQLGVQATTRNWSTVERICEMLKSSS